VDIGEAPRRGNPRRDRLEVASATGLLAHSLEDRCSLIALALKKSTDQPVRAKAQLPTAAGAGKIDRKW
jgi:hypothetical protein